MFNNREAGFARKDDTLPERYFKEPVPAGLPIVQGRRMDKKKFDKMLDEYYELYGCDSNGIPKPETLQKLGLDKEPSRLL
jgi:aldehyde:ferredoxin oxidoreductase